MARPKQIKVETLYFPKRLLQKLEYVKRYPVTLVEAPSGFGKTTALQYFFDNHVSEACPIYWHTFFDESLFVSWKAFCSVIAKFDVESGRELLKIDPSDAEGMQLASKVFLNLHCSEETYLILDDFWKFKIPEIGQFLMALSKHESKNLHIVVATQLLSTNAHKTILQSHRFSILEDTDFAFLREDIQAYYRQAGINLSETHITQVLESTEGWVIAIYLQLLSFLKTGTVESDGMDRLMQYALWEQLTEREQEFFLSVCIFPAFSLSQATTLFNKAGGGGDIEGLLRAKKGFIHFDRETHQFYLHSIFSTFLTKQFDMLPEAKKKSIYFVGGELAEKIGDGINMLKFYYKAAAFEKIFAVVLTSTELADAVDENTRSMIFDILEKTPFEIKVKYPAAMIPLAFTLFFINEHEKLMEIQHEIHEVIQQSILGEEEKNALRGEMELLLSFLGYNRIDAMSEKHRLALSLLDGPAKLISTKSTWTFGSPSVLCLFWRESGKLSEELVQMDKCMPIYYDLTNGHGTGAHIMMRAEAEFMRGNIDSAEILCHRAIFAATSKNQTSIIQCGSFLLAQIGVMRGDEDLILNAKQSLKERTVQNPEDLCRHTLDLAIGFLSILTGDDGPFPHWLLDPEMYEKRLVIMAQPFAHIIHGWKLLENGEYLKLLGLSEMFMGIASIFPNILPQLYCKIYMAQAYDRLKMEKEALGAIIEALHMALPDEVYMPFVLNFHGLQNLLPLVSSTFDKEKLAQITRLATQYEQGVMQLRAKHLTLSPREKEIFNLVKTGSTNKEIGTQLQLASGTVKNTVSRILEKTNTKSRSQFGELHLK